MADEEPKKQHVASPYDDYEILPRKKLSELHQQIEEVKKFPLGKNTTTMGLLDAIERLTESINNLNGMFQAASQEMRLEDRENTDIHQRIDPLIKKVEELGEQNKKIARGLVSIAEMVSDLKKERKKDKEEPKQEPLPQRPGPQQQPGGLPPFGAPSMGDLGMGMPGGQPQAPGFEPFGPGSIGPMGGPGGMQGMGMPPPPEEERKRKGLFGFGK
ncbi:hypothetical protein JXB02_05375 [Candidatus Woesearchaeota archaeon]|nr:hypothetical protein [Candidatus Woesearchaeota archaeon]